MTERARPARPFAIRPSRRETGATESSRKAGARRMKGSSGTGQLGDGRSDRGRSLPPVAPIRGPRLAVPPSARRTDPARPGPARRRHRPAGTAPRAGRGHRLASDRHPRQRRRRGRSADPPERGFVRPCDELACLSDLPGFSGRTVTVKQDRERSVLAVTGGWCRDRAEVRDFERSASLPPRVRRARRPPLRRNKTGARGPPDSAVASQVFTAPRSGPPSLSRQVS
jgi:hypothetical protein